MYTRQVTLILTPELEGGSDSQLDLDYTQKRFKLTILSNFQKIGENKQKEEFSLKTSFGDYPFCFFG